MTVTRTKPRVDAAHVREVLKTMQRIRLFEEKCAENYTQKKSSGSARAGIPTASTIARTGIS